MIRRNLKSTIERLIEARIDIDEEEDLEETSEGVLEDGIYNVSEIDYINKDDKPQKVLDFIKKYPKFYIASAYETETTFLLSAKPKELKNHDRGSGFNYGSTNIVENCPKKILILAEND